MPFAHPPSDEALALIAARFATLAEPTRLRLLHALTSGGGSVGTLATAIGTSPANASRHLQQLARSGFIERRRDGLEIHYAISDPSVFDLCRLVCDGLGRQGRRLQEVLPSTQPAEDRVVAKKGPARRTARGPRKSGRSPNQ